MTAFRKQKSTQATEKVNQDLKDDSKNQNARKNKEEKERFALLSLCAYNIKFETFTLSFGRHTS